VKEGNVKIKEDDGLPNNFLLWHAFWQKRWSVFVGVLSRIIDGLFNVGDKKIFIE
jgi:hypothetical protein